MNSGVEITILKVQTGETVLVDRKGAWAGDPPQTEEDRDSVAFWWTEGNGSCDCNRFICFEQAKGREVDFKTVTCGGAEQAYKIKLVIDGKTLVDEIAA